MINFMVELIKPEHYRFDDTAFGNEQLRFKDLMKENLLQQVNMNKELTHFWLIFKVDSRETMLEVLQTLPICSSFERKISELV